jgi:hypothetical protein
MESAGEDLNGQDQKGQPIVGLRHCKLTGMNAA